ncbi:MAG TPA: hypothetical protein PLX35_07650 [Cyclobacteriaceae bacterium]|nr:hypothetical protein [Cyclobacteriaceae bacterium]
MSSYTWIFVFLIATSAVRITAWGQGWKQVDKLNHHIHYQDSDHSELLEYLSQIESGIETVQVFFGHTYAHDFGVYIHPNRHSLDSTWQKDWNMPDFKSECWMVASGVATKLDMMAPRQWDKLSCEHRYADKEKTQQLITHELIHVYHGQHNGSPDFSAVEGIDWLVEGLATYAAGQCDPSRISGVKKRVAEHQVPAVLDDFWKGNDKYGLSGTLVMYIDYQYGRQKLILLLPFTNKAAVLASLGISESTLLAGWQSYVGSLK